MLIPLGFLAGSGEGFATDYELIATAFGTGSSGVIEFASIPQDYKHLQIRSVSKNTNTNANVNLTFNGITSANYSSHFLIGSGTAVSSSYLTSQSYIYLQEYASPSTISNAHSAGIIDILDYASTTKNKTTRALYGYADSSTLRTVRLSSGLFIATSAINKITFTTVTNNFTSSTRFSLYGIKG